MDAERKERLGTKWACYSCEVRFYDLKKPQAICPACQADQADRPEGEPEKTKRKKATRKKATKKKATTKKATAKKATAKKATTKKAAAKKSAEAEKA